MTEKVGNTVGEEAENEAEVEKTSGRQPFDIEAYGKENEGAVDGDGLLTAVPSTFSERKNKPLKKEAFCKEAIFIRYCAMVAEQKAEFYVKKSAELKAKADRVERFGSEEARKTAGKLAKAKAQMVKLRASLLATGMKEAELDAIIDDM